ncbi:LOW QUALITY PROTEIN: amphoterin-induced protein 1 [Tachyglossus aculeatus]|uniref:LOW QUALITY PROTEIN: amphoterin-induced protein 1 n=1 Tax=Tachyglossus aculeatus TaxID=9261 RepID=UPI0018F78C51|nr:LOW QUALITY PROTEIN: amphoterin-induced protein 1 [Tachyglossus aculeatus]
MAGPRAVWLWLCLSVPGAPGAVRPAPPCPAACLCASDILSCSKRELLTAPAHLPRYAALLDLSHNNLSRLRADWTGQRLARLHTLLLGHNRLAFISGEAFAPVPGLRHLDLSSNRLRALDELLFSQLPRLEVLLLYDNHIAEVDRSAFDGAAGLRRLYLSRNQISRFPLELIRDGAKPPELSLLDLSANHLKSLPLAELGLLPAWLRNGLYLHGNPLVCDCELYRLFRHWELRELSSVVDFREDLACSLPAPPAKRTVGVLGLGGPDLLNCSDFKECAVEAYLGDTLVIGCDARQRGAAREWVTPARERVPGQAANGTAAVLADGSLRIQPVRAEDRGTYTCHAVGEAFNETLYVEVTVYNFTQHRPHDTLNTAYTTLVGCILSVVLVLIYLYLTPCRCWCRGGDGPASHRGDSLSSSMLSTTPNHDPGDGDGKDGGAFDRRVAFLEPAGLGPGQNGKLKPGGALPGPEGLEGRRKLSDPDSVSSVFSDTPIVV